MAKIDLSLSDLFASEKGWIMQTDKLHTCGCGNLTTAMDILPTKPPDVCVRCWAIRSEGTARLDKITRGLSRDALAILGPGGDYTREIKE